jgi:hypothetical protein
MPSVVTGSVFCSHPCDPIFDLHLNSFSVDNNLCLRLPDARDRLQLVYKGVELILRKLHSLQLDFPGLEFRLKGRAVDQTGESAVSEEPNSCVKTSWRDSELVRISGTETVISWAAAWEETISELPNNAIRVKNSPGVPKRLIVPPEFWTSLRGGTAGGLAVHFMSYR